MRFAEAFADPNWGDKIIRYADKCVEMRRRGIDFDEKNDIKSLVLLRLLENNGVVKERGWKSFVDRAVRYALADQYRSRSPEAGETELGENGSNDALLGGNKVGGSKVGGNEDGGSAYTAICDAVGNYVYEQAMALPDDSLPEDASPTEWLDLIFNNLCQNFRALNEDPTNIAQGDPDTVLPILDTAAAAHLAKPEWIKTWIAVWDDIRSHNEPLNYRQIADRVGCDKNTAKKAVERWVSISGNFQLDFLDQWSEYDDLQKAEWLHSTLKGMKQEILDDIEKLRRNLDSQKWRDLNQS